MFGKEGSVTLTDSNRAKHSNEVVKTLFITLVYCLQKRIIVVVCAFFDLSEALSRWMDLGLVCQEIALS